MLQVFKYDNLPSTNKFALQNLANYKQDCIIQAETQSCGHGRFSRAWVSDKPNNCYISFVLKPDITYKKYFPNLTQYLSVVLCEVLNEYNVMPQIKWPNDVLIQNKKIAGILCETSFSENILSGIVLGLGVNLNLTAEDINNINTPATSLNLETNSTIDSNKFIITLADKFTSNYHDFLNNGFVSIKEKYISHCNFLGKTITVKNPEPINVGIATNICDDGSLEILNQNGKVEKIFSGDII